MGTKRLARRAAAGVLCAALLAALFAGCASLPGAGSAQTNAASWQRGGARTDKAMIGDDVTLEARVDSAEFADGASVRVLLFMDIDGTEDGGAILERRATVAGGRVSCTFAVPAAPELFDRADYVVPTCRAALASENGAIFRPLNGALRVYASVRTQLTDTSTGAPLAHTPYTIRRTDGAELHGTTDNDGWVHADWLEFGQYTIAPTDGR